MYNGNPNKTATLINRSTDSDGNTVEIRKVSFFKNGKPVSFSYEVLVVVPETVGRLLGIMATLGEARDLAGVEYSPATVETRPASDYKEQQKGYCAT